MVRHELVHAHQFADRGQSDHGLRFKLLAESVNAPIHCQSFTTGRLLISCGEGCADHRSKASKLVKHPETARCRPHDASMTVEHVATGRTWTDNEGYERQRAAIERSSDTEW
jgi:predicted SprT family Zn-dependent metalloprotease